MEFLDGSRGAGDCSRCNDNACSYADRHVGGSVGSEGRGRLGAGARVERYLSLCIPFRRPSLFYILQEEAYRLPLPIFPAGQKGTAGNLVCGMCTRITVYGGTSNSIRWNSTVRVAIAFPSHRAAIKISEGNHR